MAAENMTLDRAFAIIGAFVETNIADKSKLQLQRQQLFDAYKAIVILGERRRMTPADITAILDAIHVFIHDKITQKGDGVFRSRHEILGVVAEEYDELINAVRMSEDLYHVEHELMDVACACLLGAACIKAGKVDW
jgi:hypothetical protein